MACGLLGWAPQTFWDSTWPELRAALEFHSGKAGQTDDEREWAEFAGSLGYSPGTGQPPLNGGRGRD